MGSGGKVMTESPNDRILLFSRVLYREMYETAALRNFDSIHWIDALCQSVHYYVGSQLETHNMWRGI